MEPETSSLVDQCSITEPLPQALFFAVLFDIAGLQSWPAPVALQALEAGILSCSRAITSLCPPHTVRQQGLVCWKLSCWGCKLASSFGVWPSLHSSIWIFLICKTGGVDFVQWSLVRSGFLIILFFPTNIFVLVWFLFLVACTGNKYFYIKCKAHDMQWLQPSRINLLMYCITHFQSTNRPCHPVLGQWGCLLTHLYFWTVENRPTHEGRGKVMAI
jgi:hypothetical protein